MSRTLLSDQDVRDLNERFEGAHPREIVRWAVQDPALEPIAIASAFQAEGGHGPPADDVVITAGHLKLPRPGMPVTVVPPGGGRSGSTPAAGATPADTTAFTAGDGPPANHAPRAVLPAGAKAPAAGRDRGS